MYEPVLFFPVERPSHRGNGKIFKSSWPRFSSRFDRFFSVAEIGVARVKSTSLKRDVRVRSFSSWARERFSCCFVTCAFLTGVSSYFSVPPPHRPNRFATLKEKDIGGRALPSDKTSELGSIKVVWRDCVKTGQS